LLYFVLIFKFTVIYLLYILFVLKIEVILKGEKVRQKRLFFFLYIV